MTAQKVFARAEPAQEANSFDNQTDTSGRYDVALYRDPQCENFFVQFSHDHSSKPRSIGQKEITLDGWKLDLEWAKPVEAYADGRPFHAGRVAGKRIIGEFIKLKPADNDSTSWNGPVLSREKFDATAHVLHLPLEAILMLKDQNDATDEIGLAAVKRGQIKRHEGPFDVELVEAVKGYFDVPSLADISQGMLDAACSPDAEWREDPYKIIGQGEPAPKDAERKIVGRFVRQGWGGRKNQDALYLGEENFDATAAILKLPLEKIHELQDCDTSSDEIGRACVYHEGPCEVSLVDSMLEFFGVDSREDITQDALDATMTRFSLQPEPQLLWRPSDELSENQRQQIANDSNLSRDELQEAYSAKDAWGEYPIKAAARTEWQQAVANGDTQNGYWEWVGCLLSELSQEARTVPSRFMDEHDVEPPEEQDAPDRPRG